MNYLVHLPQPTVSPSHFITHSYSTTLETTTQHVQEQLKALQSLKTRKNTKESVSPQMTVSPLHYSFSKEPSPFHSLFNFVFS